MSRQDWAAAERAFSDSEALDPAAGTLLNRGECRAHLGALVPAWWDFTQALRELPADDDRRELARGRIAELEKQLPLLVVTLRGDAPAGTRVLENGAALPPAALGLARPVDAGRVGLAVTAPGRPEAHFTIETRPGQTARVEVAAADEVSATGPAQAHSSTRIAGFVVGGVGVAGVAVGAVTGALAFRRASAYRADCPNQVCATQTALSAADTASNSAKSLAVASTASFIIGSASAGVGLYLVLRHPRGPSSAGTAAWSFGVSAVPGGAAAAWLGAF
jgi:hypothetical protein